MYYLTNTDTIGRCKFIGSAYGNGGVRWRNGNYYCRFLDVEISIPLRDKEGNFLKPDKEKSIKQVEESEFYKMIASLPG